MVLVRRLGGWRPVEATDGVGRLRRRGGTGVDGVRYAFEVWHQFVQGFHGPYRCEGAVAGLAAEDLAALVGEDLLLELDDGRFLPLRLAPDAKLVAHSEPQPTDPWSAGTH